MSDTVRPVRRGGHLVERDGRIVTWSMAEGARGRRWRWSVTDRRGDFVAAHTVELDPDGRFAKLESATAAGLLTLHREADGGEGHWRLDGNRVWERGVDHLTVPSPAPEAVVVGSGSLGLAIASRSLSVDGATSAGLTLDVVEVGDDLGVRIVEASVRRPGDGILEIRTGLGSRRVELDADGLPAGDPSGSTSWPLENA